MLEILAIEKIVIAAKSLAENGSVTLFGAPIRVTLEDNSSCPGYFIERKAHKLRLATRRTRAVIENISFDEIAGISPLSANDSFLNDAGNKLENLLKEIVPDLFL